MADYTRNYLYLTAQEQTAIKRCRLLLGGCGIGSNIAECALRLGFEHITLADGDRVEPSNLNRQNYRREDTGVLKTEALRQRLLQINPQAVIDTIPVYLDAANMKRLVPGHQLAINALDFKTDAPFVFDQLCHKHQIPVLHPYNFGWATLVLVFIPGGAGLTAIANSSHGFEKKVAAFLINRLKGYPRQWIQQLLNDYAAQPHNPSPPQLAVGSWLAGGACTALLYRLATGKPVKAFPEFYFLSTE